MIRDTISYKNKTILTIYHNHFPDDLNTSHHSRSEHIGRYIIRFSEEYVPDEVWKQCTDYAWEEHMLLTPQTLYNPYGSAACADMIHHICLKKPSVIFPKNGSTISEEELCNIIDFIKKYTGMDLSEKPIFLGDTFLFSPQKFDYHSNREHSVILPHVETGMTIILSFKKDHNIIESRIINISENAEEYEIKTDCDWHSHDILVYRDGHLFYSNTDISYMRTMEMSFSFGNSVKRIPLKALQDHFDITIPWGEEHRTIGEIPDPVIQTLSEHNTMLTHKIRNNRHTDDFLFISPNEKTIAFRAIADFLFQAADEIWLFDSYFTDRGHDIHKMTDWLRLSANCPAPQTNIVFYSRQAAGTYNPKELKQLCRQDYKIQNAFDTDHQKKLRFLQTSSPIHDRFFIARTGNDYSGLSIGTSLNSLDRNFYCIQRLPHKSAKEILKTICNWLPDNLIDEEEMKYE